MPENCIIPIQGYLDDLYRYNKPYGFPRQPTGAIEALASNANSSVLETTFVRSNGKNQKYQLTYIAPDCAAVLDCDDVEAGICATGDSEDVQVMDFTIDNCKSTKTISLTIDQFRDLCNVGPNEFFMKQLMGKMDMLMRAINADIITDIVAGVGCFGTGDAGPHELALIDPVTGVPNWGADTVISADFMDAGFSTVPILLGGRELLHYANGRRNGGMNDNGVDIGGMGDFPMFYDNQLEGIGGIDGTNQAMLAIAPQIIHIVRYLENVGEFQSNLKIGPNTDPLSLMRAGEVYNYGIIQDPKTGWMFDINAVFDACDKVWKISLKSKYDTAILPLTTCYAACFTGILKYSICPAPTLACPA